MPKTKEQNLTPSPTETPEPSHTPIQNLRNEPIVGFDGCVVIAPPAELNIDPFYAKYFDAGGILVLSSAAFHEFSYTIYKMGLARLEPDFNSKLDKLYNETIQAGL